jgi:outer membrane receptor protein involved in Fe transport
MAFSLQTRKLTYRLDSNNTPADERNPLSCTGLRLVLDPSRNVNLCGLQSQEFFQAFSYSRSEIGSSVKEAAIEFDLPLLNDKFLARDVSLNGAVRYTNYSTSGSVNTWKVGLDWKFNDSLSFRGTRSRDIRAPTLYELFAPTVVGNNNLRDPLTNTLLDNSVIVNGVRIGPATTFQVSNPNLKPEIGDTTTLGFVYRPGWAQGLSVSIDGYFINVRDAIIALNGANGPTALACPQSGGSSFICELVTRPLGCCNSTAANSATAYYTKNFNLARQWTQGADLEINYTHDLLNRPFNVRLLTSFQPNNVLFNPVLGKIDNAGFQGSNPIWRATLVAGMSLTENLKVSVQQRWRNSMTWTPKQYAPLNTLVVVNVGPISPQYYTNLNVGYALKRDGLGQADFYLNVANLFDRAPVIAGGVPGNFPGNTAPVIGDDLVGRYYTLGFRYKL